MIPSAVIAAAISLPVSAVATGKAGSEHRPQPDLSARGDWLLWQAFSSARFRQKPVRRLLVEESTPAGFGCFILVVAYGPGGAIQRQADDLGGGKTDRPAGQLALAAEPVEALQVGP